MVKQVRVLASIFAAVFVSLSTVQAQAQPYPAKPIYIVVGVSPGGSTDITARLLAKQLSGIWGQPVIVENRPGAAGAIANEFVAKSHADGYTLLVVSNDITALSAYRSDLPYDLLRDFVPVSLVSTAPEALVVTPSLPVHNVRALIALAKSQPGKLTYGSPGVGSITNLETARLASMAGINLIHVPYKGAAATVSAVAEGEVDMTFAGYASLQGLAQAGKLRVLGIAAPQRLPSLPSLPTIAESGGPQFVYIGWFALFAPAGLPQDVLAKINTAIVKADSSPDMRTGLAKVGLQPAADSLPQFAAFIQNDLREAKKMVKLAGLKP